MGDGGPENTPVATVLIFVKGVITPHDPRGTPNSEPVYGCLDWMGTFIHQYILIQMKAKKQTQKYIYCSLEFEGSHHSQKGKLNFKEG